MHFASIIGCARVNVELKCGGVGPRWSLNTTDHMAFCRSSSQRGMADEDVEINAAMFAKQNEAYLEKVFPEPAPKAANGNGDSGAGIESDAFDSD